MLTVVRKLGNWKSTSQVCVQVVFFPMWCSLVAVNTRWICMVLVAGGKHLRTHFPKFKIFIRLLLVTAFIGFTKEALHSLQIWPLKPTCPQSLHIQISNFDTCAIFGVQVFTEHANQCWILRHPITIWVGSIQMFGVPVSLVSHCSRCAWPLIWWVPTSPSWALTRIVVDWPNKGFHNSLLTAVIKTCSLVHPLFEIQKMRLE
jgi:hypothetical protein